MPPSHDRRVILACAALVAVGVGWMLWIDRTALPTDAGAGATAAPTKVADTAALPTGGEPRLRVATPTPDAGTRPRGAWTLRVVDDEDRLVQGAEVACHLERRGGEALVAAERRQRAWAGEVSVTDPQGTVTIPRAEVIGWVVYGRAPGRWGSAFVRLDEVDATPTLRLRRDLTIRARVLDGFDRPVEGIRVVLADEHHIDRRSSGASAMTRAPDGIATFHHAQEQIAESWGGDGVVALGFPTGDLVFERLRFDDLPTDPVVLRMPAHGSVQINLVDKQRQPVRDLTETVYGKVFERTDSGERAHSLPFRAGRMELPHVGLGLNFRVAVEAAEVSGTLEFAGPTQPHERVDHALVVERHPTLSGRLVDDQGAPQQGYWFATHMQTTRGFYNQYFETAADGRFHLGVPALSGDGAGRRGIWFHRTVADIDQHAWCDMAARDLHAGRNELGDITLRAPPVLVAGRVVDDTGQPVAGAEFMVFEGDPEGELWRTSGIDSEQGASDVEGRFRILGFHAGRSLHLRAAHNKRHGSLVAFAPGDHGVTCVLPSTGDVTMDVTFADGLDPDGVLFVHRNAATGATRSMVSHYVLADDTVHWRALRPGRYDFSIRLIGSTVPLLHLQNVTVKGGATTVLPAQEIGRSIESIRLRVTGPDGAAVDRASAIVDPDGLGGRPRVALPIRLGELNLQTPRTPVDLLVVAPGYRSRLVRGVHRDVTVQLEDGLEVELVVTLPAGFPGDGTQLMPLVRRYDPADPDPRPWESGHELFLHGAGSTYYRTRHPWLWSQGVPVGAGGRVVLRVPAPGEYAVDWELRGATRRELGAAARRVFRVDQTVARTRVPIELEASDVR